MFKALFNIILNMVATVVQIIVWPINQIIVNTIPDVSDKILQVTNTLNSVFDVITWGLGLLPSVIVETLLFIVTVEIARHTVYISTKKLVQVWNLLQKIKFW